MPAISPAQVERFAERAFPKEILEAINGILLTNSGKTAVIPADELAELACSDGALNWADVSMDDLHAITDLYRAVGWRVLYRRTDLEGNPRPCWLFNASFL